MAVDDSIAATVLAKCGRCCCICRRFRPTKLQVHHIVPQSEGGTDDFGNLIALCITCHSDVHTRRPFARRFTVQELIAHRDAVYSLVENGELVPAEDEVFGSFNQTAPATNFSIPEFELSELASRILVGGSESREGRILFIKAMRGNVIQAGEFSEQVNFGREEARLEAALEELESAELISRESWNHGGIWKITNTGYIAADAMASASVARLAS